MVGFTPSLSTAVWVGTTDGTQPLENKWGSPVYGSGLPSDIWKNTMDGALKGTDNESFPKPTEIGGYAGPPAPPPPPQPSPAPPSEAVIQPTIEVAPGITIPFGPPTTVPAAPPGESVPVPGRDPSGRRSRRARRFRRECRVRSAAAASAAVTESGDTEGEHRAARGSLRSTVSPQPLAADVRSVDDRDLPSRTDALGGALSQMIGGPVGRHALIGRARFLTPLRVMLRSRVVFLALGYSTKAACLVTTGSGTADQKVANWQNQRAYYELCYSDTVPLYTANC